MDEDAETEQQEGEEEEPQDQPQEGAESEVEDELQPEGAPSTPPEELVAPSVSPKIAALRHAAFTRLMKAGAAEPSEEAPPVPPLSPQLLSPEPASASSTVQNFYYDTVGNVVKLQRDQVWSAIVLQGPEDEPQRKSRRDKSASVP